MKNGTDAIAAKAMKLMYSFSKNRTRNNRNSKSLSKDLRKYANDYLATYPPEDLEVLAREAQSVSDYAKAVSSHQQAPVLVVGNAKTGVPYTWRIPNWQTQVRTQLSPQNIDKFQLEFRKNKAKTKDETLAAFITGKAWIERKLLAYLVFATAHKFPSYGSDPTSQNNTAAYLWEKYNQQTPMLKHSPTIIVVDSSCAVGSKYHPAALHSIYEFEKNKGKHQPHFIQSLQTPEPKTNAKLILLNPTQTKRGAWHDDNRMLVHGLNRPPDSYIPYSTSALFKKIITSGKFPRIKRSP